MGFLKREPELLFGLLTAVVYFFAGKTILGDLSNVGLDVGSFVWIFAAMLGLSFVVVRHADALAIQLGEPLGTLILTLSVISIEVSMVAAVMLTGEENPTLGRDMMFSVVMIVLTVLVGLSLLLGGRNHWEQRHNLQGANAFLVVLIPMSVLALILPNFTRSTAVGSFSPMQTVFLIVVTVCLYGAFLALQTLSHRDYFRAPDAAEDTGEDAHDHGIELHSVPAHATFLILAMLPIVVLSKSMAKLVDQGIFVAGAPAALGGFIIAILVLTPEGLSAVIAAKDNRLQRSINICLGSALATIGLTLPAVLIIGMVTGREVILGLGNPESVVLLLTLLVSSLNFSSGRSNWVQGVVHLVLFATYVVLIFD
jgi:Ca2+:H+ antiporter